jgi:hypothetical protein
MTDMPSLYGESVKLDSKLALILMTVISISLIALALTTLYGTGSFIVQARARHQPRHCLGFSLLRNHYGQRGLELHSGTVFYQQGDDACHRLP